MLTQVNHPASLVCKRCLQATRRFGVSEARRYTSQPRHPTGEQTTPKVSNEEEGIPKADASTLAAEPGAMTRRLQEATEEALFTGGAVGKRAVQDAGFSEELKDKLLNKIADAKFKEEYLGAFTEANITTAAGEGTRHIANAQPWTGEEAMPDAVLRMLDDSKKPLKPELRGKFEPPVIDTRVKRNPVVSPGRKAVTARDRASLYAGMKMKEDKGLSDKEREELKREFRARFEPAARAVPATISGLTALANERIEEAIARGQFKNLPRGKALDRDPGASNPFVDTTEYLMNRIIQRQDIVPPWIEKQQELVKAANAFRVQLRSNWKRHASRMIAAKGGSLQEQMARAEQFAAAERLHNPWSRDDQSIASANNPEMTKSLDQDTETSTTVSPSASPLNSGTSLPPPFRDPAWEKAEHAYLNLSIENLNSITRSYNLMAPELAKKPYYTLQRELEACYADVAPLVANEIKERATRPASSSLIGKPSPAKGGGIISSFGGGGTVRIYENANAKPYGFKEWWSDFWKKE